MRLVSFESLFAELIVCETRTAAVTESASIGNPRRLPVDEYGFVEWYCAEPECDCRRVVFFIMSTNSSSQMATISHAFEPPAKRSWMPAQTFLDPLFPQTDLSAALLLLCKDTVLEDADYCRQLERHYRMVKDAMADPDHPCKRLLRDLEEDEAETAAKSRAARLAKGRGKRRWR